MVRIGNFKELLLVCMKTTTLNERVLNKFGTYIENLINMYE